MMQRMLDIPSPTSLQGKQLTALDQKYKELVFENAKLKHNIIEGLQSMDIPLPTAHQVQQLNALEAQYKHLVAENRLLTKNIWKNLECMRVITDTVGDGMKQLFAENTQMARDIQASLGPESHYYAPLLTEVDKTTSRAEALNKGDKKLVNEIGQCIDSMLDRGCDEADLIATLQQYFAGSDTATGQLSNADLSVIDDMLKFVDSAEHNQPSSASHTMDAITPGASQPAAGGVGGNHNGAPEQEISEDIPSGDWVDNFFRDQILELEIANHNLQRPRRRRNINGSTRAKRRRERAREAAAAAAAA